MYLFEFFQGMWDMLNYDLDAFEYGIHDMIYGTNYLDNLVNGHPIIDCKTSIIELDHNIFNEQQYFS